MISNAGAISQLAGKLLFPSGQGGGLYGLGGLMSDTQTQESRMNMAQPQIQAYQAREQAAADTGPYGSNEQDGPQPDANLKKLTPIAEFRKLAGRVAKASAGQLPSMDQEISTALTRFAAGRPSGLIGGGIYG